MPLGDKLQFILIEFVSEKLLSQFEVYKPSADFLKLDDIFYRMCPLA
jgi:hypothetical protein